MFIVCEFETIKARGENIVCNCMFTLLNSPLFGLD